MSKLDIPDWMLTASESEFTQRMTDAMKRASRGMAATQRRQWRTNPQPILRLIAEGPMPVFHGLSIQSQAEELDRLVGDRVNLGVGIARSGQLIEVLRFQRDGVTDAIKQAAARANKEVDSGREQIYSIDVKQNNSEVASEVNQLRNSEQATPPFDVLRHADLASLRAKHEAELYVVMTRRVFHDAEPSLAGFRQYLKSLAGHNPDEWTADSRVDAVETANYWKRELKVKFTYDSGVCTLKAKDRGRGGFQLRMPGATQTPIYTDKRFPSLLIRKLQEKRE